MLTFDDDECEDLCTLLAQDVLAADTDLGKAVKNVVFLSINVNPYSPGVSSVRSWTDAHGLGKISNWYFATGTAARLRDLADAYGVPVKTDPTTSTVTHGAEMFFIDPSGRERYIGEFGTKSANTSAFGAATATVANGLLGHSQQASITGPTQPGAAGNTALEERPRTISLPSLSTGSETKIRTGKYTVLNFWSSSCSACAAEAPAIETTYRHSQGAFRFYGIDVSDSAATGREYARDAGVTYAELLDRSGSTAARFEIPGLPFTVVLDPEGAVVVRHPGAMSAEQLDYLLNTLKTQSSE